MANCTQCLHKRICELWRSAECQDASCYSGLDGCDCFTGWVSVEDDKPKRRGHYFVTYKFAGSDMRFYGEAFWHDDIPDNGYVQGNHFSNEGVDGMYVTHWMEIQKLPVVQEVQKEEPK